MVQMMHLLARLDGKYDPDPVDAATGDELTWPQVFRRERFGLQWQSHPEFLLEQKTCGGIPEEYFDIGEQMLLKKT